MKTTTLKKFVSLTVGVLQNMAGVAARGLTVEMSLQLAAAPAGRMVLHTLCAIRDHRFGWHWRGVAREFALA